MKRQSCNKSSCSKGRCESSVCCNQVIQAIVGPTGPTGPSGENILVRSTTTLDSNQMARVDTSHIGNTTYLDFYIPKGDIAPAEKIVVGETKQIKSDRPARVEERIEDDVHYLDFFIPQGATGPKGDKGEQGEQGKADEVSFDCVYSINFDEPARVEDNQMDGVHHLSLYIPRGVTGATGDVGPQGEQGIQGPQGPKGDKGDTGPKGDKGEQGERGLPGEIGISQVITIDGTETVEPDQEAEVQDDFDRNIHHLTFYIPRGATGTKGEQGIQGPQGEAGEAGPAGSTLNINATIYSTDDLPLTNGEVVRLNKTLTANGLVVDNGRIRVNYAGTYIISFTINYALNAIVGETMSVMVNGAVIEASRRPIPNQRTSTSFLVMRLENNSTVELVPTVAQSLTLSSTDAPSASLSVINIA